MGSAFYIVLRIKTPEGFEPYGRFCLGYDAGAAGAIFSQLFGNTDVDDRNVLHIDFMETVNDVPVNLRIISCTLQELMGNIRIITKEVFKLLNLKDI